ncbi:hypothetical protein [Rothia terrae]|uniref:SbtR family transcriptional regulator n=1 Tax=Rothia terrae TaxID=396015 RepID=UPI0031D8A906
MRSGWCSRRGSQAADATHPRSCRRPRRTRARRTSLHATAQETSLYKLTAWLESLANWFTTYEGLTDPMRRAVEEAQSPLGMKCYDVIAQLDDLLQEAKAEGAIKDGVTGRDLYLATLGLAWVAQHSEDPKRLYELLARGWMA